MKQNSPSASMNSLDAEKYMRDVGLDTKWRANWWREDFLGLLGKRLAFERVGKMLDVGCGAGLWGILLSRVLPTGTLIAGVDKVPDFIDRAIIFAKESGVQSFEYKVGDADALPYEDRTFDLVTCQTLLIHVKDPVLVLSEMKRVLKPGGLLLLAEPNNVMGFFSRQQFMPRPDWHIILSQLEFFTTCVQGKKNLGWGDSTIGDQLPSIVSKLGFEDIKVAQNEKGPVLIPPYQTEEQKFEIGNLQRINDENGWIGFGSHEDTLKHFIAGGGDKESFSQLWSQAMTYQKEMFGAIAAKTYSGSCGSVLYTIAGRKPTTD